MFQSKFLKKAVFIPQPTTVYKCETCGEHFCNNPDCDILKKAGIPFNPPLIIEGLVYCCQHCKDDDSECNCPPADCKKCEECGEYYCEAWTCNDETERGGYHFCSDNCAEHCDIDPADDHAQSENRYIDGMDARAWNNRNGKKATHPDFSVDDGIVKVKKAWATPEGDPCTGCDGSGEETHAACGGKGCSDCREGKAACSDCGGVGYEPRMKTSNVLSDEEKSIIRKVVRETWQQCADDMNGDQLDAKNRAIVLMDLVAGQKRLPKELLDKFIFDMSDEESLALVQSAFTKTSGNRDEKEPDLYDVLVERKPAEPSAFHYKGAPFRVKPGRPAYRSPELKTQN
jgi:hypothetical protein